MRMLRSANFEDGTFEWICLPTDLGVILGGAGMSVEDRSLSLVVLH
jgi:hypothetical protein